MPYASTKSLPKPVKTALPAKAQRIFMHAFNGTDTKLKDQGAAKATRETRASQAGWAAVKNAGYRKGPAETKWKAPKKS